MKKGFSLVELLVSLGIMAVILSIIVSNQLTYTEAASLVNAADDLSLTLSQAQAYGISVKEFKPNTGEFRAGYGVSVYSAAGSQTYNKAYILFADWSGGINDGIYTGGFSCPTGLSEECLEKKEMPGGNYIYDICWIRINGNETCNVGRVDMTFVRPDVEARFVVWNNSINIISTPNLKGVRIILRSPSGLSRSVLVYTTGQISIQ